MVSVVVLPPSSVAKSEERKKPTPQLDRPHLQQVLEAALASGVHEVVCVGCDLASARRQVTVKDERLIWLIYDGAQSVLSAGLWAIHPHSNGVLFLAGDHPFIRGELIDALVERFETSRALIIAPSFHGQAGHPLLFRRELFPELLRLRGDQSASGLLEKYRDRTDLLPWAEDMAPIGAGNRPGYARLREPV